MTQQHDSFCISSGFVKCIVCLYVRIWEEGCRKRKLQHNLHSHAGVVSLYEHQVCCKFAAELIEDSLPPPPCSVTKRYEDVKELCLLAPLVLALTVCLWWKKIKKQTKKKKVSLPWYVTSGWSASDSRFVRQTMTSCARFFIQHFNEFRLSSLSRVKVIP